MVVEKISGGGAIDLLTPAKAVDITKNCSDGITLSQKKVNEILSLLYIFVVFLPFLFAFFWGRACKKF